MQTASLPFPLQLHVLQSFMNSVLGLHKNPEFVVIEAAVVASDVDEVGTGWQLNINLDN